MTDAPQFLNPYEADGDDVHKTTVNLGARDLAFLRGLNTNTGVLQTTIGILAKALVRALRENNLTEYDPDAYERAIAGLTVTLGPGWNGHRAVPAGPPGPSQAEIPHPDDGRGAVGLARDPERSRLRPGTASSQRPRRGQKG